MKRIAYVLVLFFALPKVMLAEEHCLPSETIRQCYHHFVPILPKEAQADAEAASAKVANATQKTVAAANTGISSLVSPSQSASKDFLSLLSAALEAAAQGNDAKPVTLDYNIPISLLGEQEQVKLQAVLAKPDLSADLKQRLGDNTSGTKTLQDALSYADDVTFSATLNPATQHFGRSIIPHRDLFQSLLINAYEHNSKSLAAEQDLESKSFISLGVSSTNGKLDMPFNDLIADKVQRDATIAAVEAAARDSVLPAAVAFAKNFALLLSNQPQVYGSAIYHSRKEIAGSNETSAKLTYELHKRNLNGFYSLNADCAPTAVAKLTKAATKAILANAAELAAKADAETAMNNCVASLNAFADEKAAFDGVTLSIQYNRTDHIAVDLPQYTINYTVPSGHKFIYSVIYGRPMSVSQSTEKDGRVDFSLNYEDTKTTKAEDVVSLSHRTPLAAATTVPPHDRLVASVTFTQKLSDTISIPVSLIYANHAQFLSTVDKKLNVHFGLVYKLPTKQ